MIKYLHWMLAFRRLHKECFCQGIKQEGHFATLFIMSNIDQWITSKLQATISINNTLISGSKTLVNSIFKKASHVNRFHGAHWQCLPTTKDCNGRTKWEGPEKPCPPDTSLLPSLLLATTPAQNLKTKTTKNTKTNTSGSLFGGNKLEINNSKWALEPLHT